MDPKDIKAKKLATNSIKFENQIERNLIEPK